MNEDQKTGQQKEQQIDGPKIKEREFDKESYIIWTFVWLPCLQYKP